jgi:superfamily II RNA helicase
MVAIVFEARKGDASAHVDPSLLAEIKPLAERRIREFRRIEHETGLRELVKEPDFRMSSPTYLWANGEPLEKVRQVTSVSDGDLVRQFRMAIQLMRQVQGQIRDDRDLRARFGTAIELLNRDEVDAKRQLELG